MFPWSLDSGDGKQEGQLMLPIFVSALKLKQVLV